MREFRELVELFVFNTGEILSLEVSIEGVFYVNIDEEELKNTLDEKEAKDLYEWYKERGQR